MSKTLFISDLHLDADRPTIVALFDRFLGDVAADANALYILGDLFEYWVGDDQLDHDPLAARIAAALRTLEQGGTKIFFMRGNRDFLIGARFAEKAGVTLLEDPTVIASEAGPILLMHGDTLCTDDVAYQQFRLQARDPAWQARVLAQPYPERIKLARSLREQSDTAKSNKPEYIMDVSPAAVEAALRQHQVNILIHGHTHRPATHQLNVEGKACFRHVLQDWHDVGGYILASEYGINTFNLKP
jgi:UDP-2,3-diacylglucosamine hydrolase